MIEFESKIEKIRELLGQQHLDAILLQRVSSFAWATCGANSATNSAETIGSASLLITRQNLYLLTSKTEEARLAIEEGLAQQGWEFVTHPWYQEDGLARLAAGLSLGADSAYPGAIDLSQQVARLRSRMDPPEILRMKNLCADCASAMYEAIQTVQVGMSENEIAALLAGTVEKRGIRPVVNLVAADQRVLTYRHPLPTVRKLQKFVIIVLCGRRQGQVANLTRFVHFGPIPQEILTRARAVAEIDTTFISSTIPGRTLGEVFSMAQDAYSKAGFPDEWKNLHQGGIAGYEPREFTAVPDSMEQIHSGQFFAWNPTLAGVKSEDTIFLGEGEIEILTEIHDWPMIEVEGLDGKVYQRPAILQK